MGQNNKEAVQTLWDATNAKVNAGACTREDWIAHISVEMRLVEQFKLNPIIQLGVSLGFVDNEQDIANALATAKALPVAKH